MLVDDGQLLWGWPCARRVDPEQVAAPPAMTARRDRDGVVRQLPDLDFEEMSEGYSFTGTRAHGIHEWRLRRDDREFHQLARKLAKNAARRRHYRDGHTAYIERTRRAARERARATRVPAAPTECTCSECGATFTQLAGVPGPKPKHCSQRCYQRRYGRERDRKRTRRSVRCGLCGELGHNRRGCGR